MLFFAGTIMATTQRSSEKLPLLMSTGAAEECRLRNDRQSYFSVVRDLVLAQFVLGDQELTTRLWKDVGDRDLDVGRIVNLLYRCSFHDDDEQMRQVDDAFLSLDVL